MFKSIPDVVKHLELSGVMFSLNRDQQLEILKIAKLLQRLNNHNLTNQDKEAMESYEALKKILENQID